MRTDVRAVAKLRGEQPVDVTAALAPVLGALTASGPDLGRLGIACDWIQYRGNFREPAEARPVLAAPVDEPAAGQGSARTTQPASGDGACVTAPGWRRSGRSPRSR